MSPPVTVPFFSFEGINNIEKLRQSVDRVLNSQKYILGIEVENFEREFALHTGVSFCISTANGTDALELALRTLGVGAGDQVLAVANAGFYSSTAIYNVGAFPVYIDIDPNTLCMDPQELKKALLKTSYKAVIVTHLYGQMAPMKNILEVARNFGLPVIEDCAQAHGATLDQKRAGSFGDLACFSFYPTKNLGALGDAGAVVTSNPDFANKLKSLRQYGWKQKYFVDEARGRNSRLDEIQAAMLLSKLPELDGLNLIRRQIAQKYSAAFKNYPLKLVPSAAPDYVAHLFVIRTPDRKKFASYLLNQGIATDIHYPVPDYLQSAYRSSQKKGDLPQTESACETVLSLPCYPGLKATQIDQVIVAVNSFFSSGSYER